MRDGLLIRKFDNHAVSVNFKADTVAVFGARKLCAIYRASDFLHDS